MNETSSSPDPFWVAAFVLLGLLAIGLRMLVISVGRDRVREWAESEGFKVLKMKLWGTYGGSDELSYSAKAGSRVFYVKVENADGNILGAWIDVGGVIAALRDRKPKIVWDNRREYLEV
jgi:hypothetical protein